MTSHVPKNDMIERVQNAAANRYATLLWYEQLCRVLAWIIVALGAIGFLTCVIVSIAAERLGFFGIAFALVPWTYLGWLSAMVTASLIKAFVDIAINSFIQVELAKHTD